ncbi:MAG: hypothetical protein ABW217_07260 [Polyangiaceae bacterium]
MVTGSIGSSAPARRQDPRHALFVLFFACVTFACGPQTQILHAAHVDGCTPEHKFTAVQSGNVLAFTVAKDSPGDANDEIITVLSYKETSPGSGKLELTPSLDPSDPTQVNDQTPAMTASVDGTSACIEPLGTGDSVGDACLVAWLGQRRCYELTPDQ